VVVALVLSVVAAGCGGDDDPSTTSPGTEWAADFCSAFTTWTSELQRVGQTLTLSPSTETVRQAGEDVETATDELVAELDALDVPDTESGQEVVAAVEDLSTTVEAEIADIEDALAGLSEESGVSVTVPAVNEAFAAMRTAASTALQDIQGAIAGSELAEDFEQASSCDELTDQS
jgi:hypothetical protein